MPMHALVSTAVIRDEQCTLASWLQHLRGLMPPRGVVHVGAGTGTNLPDYAAWDLRELVLIEADEAAANCLADWALQQSNVEVIHALVTPSTGDAIFYLVSNPEESGLLPAESQRAWWRNIQARGERSMPGRTLDQLFPVDRASQINWLVVDCLPAALILDGASHLLRDIDVVLTRVTNLPFESPTCDGGQQAVCTALAAHGFRKIAFEEDRMPLLARVLFVRAPDLSQRHAVGAPTFYDPNAAGGANVQASAGLPRTVNQCVEVIQSLQDALAQRESLVEQLESAQQSGTAERDTLLNERLTLQAQLVTALSERDTLLAVRTSLSSQVDDLQSSLVELLEHKALDERLVVQQAAEISALTARLDASERGVASSLQVLSEREATAAQLQNALQQLTDENQFVLASLQRAQAELVHAAQEAGSLNGQVLTLTSQLLERDELRTQVAQLEASAHQLSQAKQALDTSLADAQQRSHQLATELEALSAHANSQSLQLAECNANAVQLADRLKEQEVELSESRRQLDLAADSRHYFDMEMAKAQAQVALIRDVLLRPVNPGEPV